jgi:hypothetical protein
MNLKDFSFVSPVIQAGEILRAIEVAIPPEAIERVLQQTNSHEDRTRSLPADLVVTLVIAMSLWSRDSMRNVLKNLVDGLTEAWVKVGKYWRVPMFISNYSSSTKIGSASNESIISSGGASDSDNRNVGGVFKWATDCSH